MAILGVLFVSNKKNITLIVIFKTLVHNSGSLLFMKPFVKPFISNSPLILAFSFDTLHCLANFYQKVYKKSKRCFNRLIAKINIHFYPGHVYL